MLPLLNAAGVIDKGFMEDAFVSWRTPASTATGPDQSGGTAVISGLPTGAARHGTAVISGLQKRHRGSGLQKRHRVVQLCSCN